MTTFKNGQLVWDNGSKRKGKFMGYNRDMGKTSRVEFIVKYDEETGQRTTELKTVDTENLRVYVDKTKKQQRKPLQIKVKYFDQEIEKLSKIAIGDWIDLRAAETIELKQGEFKLIPLGVGMQLPRGFEANIVPRSSTFKNFGIIETNSMGVIDESYCGDNDQWFFPAYALRDTLISKNDRICQFRINRKMPKVDFVEVEVLGNEDRGGHGSTGTK